MLTRIFSVFFVVTLFCLANGQVGQVNPFDMSGFFNNLGGNMQNMFQNMQNAFKQLVPWYNGPNVCVDEKFQPDPVNQEFMSNEFGNSNSEICRGNNFKYICVASMTENGVALQRIRKYECCPGFVRAAEGPGCVQNNAVGG